MVVAPTPSSSTTVITNEEIILVQKVLLVAIKIARAKEIGLRSQYESLEKVKFLSRKVEQTPAGYRDEPDPDNVGETIRVRIRKATMKDVYDVVPKSMDDPSVDLNETLRAKIFNQVKASLD